LAASSSSKESSAEQVSPYLGVTTLNCIYSRVVAAVANSLLYGASYFSFLHLLCCVKIYSPSLLHSSLRLWWQSCSIRCIEQHAEGDRDCFFYREIHVSCYPLKLLPLRLCSAAAFLADLHVTFTVISTSLGPSCPSCTHCFYFYMSDGGSGSIIARSQWMCARGKTCQHRCWQIKQPKCRRMVLDAMVDSTGWLCTSAASNDAVAFLHSPPTSWRRDIL